MWLDRSAVHNGAQQREEVGRGEDRRSAFLGRMRVSAYVNDANGEPEVTVRVGFTLHREITGPTHTAAQK
jgi:hypothetical protein